MLTLDLAQLFLGAQIDRAEPFALAPNAVKRSFDLIDLRQLSAGLELSEFSDRLGLNLEHVANFAGDIGKAPLAAFVTLLGARCFFTGGAQGFERSAGVAVGSGQRVLSLSEPVGSGPPASFRTLDLPNQCATLLGECRR